MAAQQSLQILDTLFLILSFVMGMMIGSFLNVCVWRLPRNESVVRPRSRCPKCGTLIAWYDNLPVLSWLALGARCRTCREPISWQYPLVELLTGVLFALVYWKFGMTLASPVYMLLVAGLVLVTFVDLADWTIPNEVTYPGIPLGLALGAVGMFFPSTGLIVTNVFDALLGAFLGGGILYALDKLALAVWKKPGMGFGDVKLLAMMGAFFGWKSIFVIVMISSLLGSIVGVTLLAVQRKKGEDMKGHYLPFGPYLAAAGVLFLFFGPEIIALYTGMMRPPEAPDVFSPQ